MRIIVSGKVPVDSSPVPRCTTVNAANLCPSLNYVDTMVKWIQDVLACDISFPLRGELATASQACAVEEIKIWIGQGGSNAVAPHLIAITRNSTEGNNILNIGLYRESGQGHKGLWRNETLDVVEAVIEVIANMQNGKLPINLHKRHYA